MTSYKEFDVDFAAAEELTSLTEAQKVEMSMADPMGTGFFWYTPPLAASTHETAGHEWIISGHDMQVLTTVVPPGETVVTEPGSFFFGSGDIKTDVEFTCCYDSAGCNRICGGESCVKVLLTNQSSQPGVVGLTPGFPAKVVPIKFGTHIREDHMLLAQPGAYLSHLGNVDVSCDLDTSCLNCCCGGFGCCRQKISGTKDSVAFLSAGGTIVYRQLAEGERIIVDSNSIVAIEESVTVGLASNGRCCMCFCGGEGCCSTTLTGPGKVFMQSMNFQKFKRAVKQTIDRGDGTGTQSSGQAVGGVA